MALRAGEDVFKKIHLVVIRSSQLEFKWEMKLARLGLDQCREAGHANSNSRGNWALLAEQEVQSALWANAVELQHQAPKCNPKANSGESYPQFEPAS